MTGICSIPHCGRPRETYGNLCSTHKATARRHGHPLMRGVTVFELAPYVKRVQKRIAKAPHLDAWKVLHQRWQIAADIAHGYEREIKDGSPYQANRREAYRLIATVAQRVEADRVIATALGMFMLAEERPQRFLSDDAFWFQVARRIRGLTTIYSRSYIDAKSGKPKRVYSDLSPRTLREIARLIIEAFGVAGLYVAKLEQKERDAKVAEQQRFHAALEELAA